jgi:hypothetical protein
MSKGSPIIGLRVTEPLYSRILETIERNNLTKHGEPWTITTWILDCVRDKLAHQDAAKAQRERRKAERNARRCAALDRLAADVQRLRAKPV